MQLGVGQHRPDMREDEKEWRKKGGRVAGRVTNNQDDKDISKAVQDTGRKEITINLGVCACVGVCPRMVLIAKQRHYVNDVTGW